VSEHVWTYLLTGECRSGAGAIMSAINNRTGAVCYVDLFHEDKDIRREAHESYFGPPASKSRPEWFIDQVTNPWQYLAGTVFIPRHDELSIGCYVPYDTIRTLELYDFMEENYREGGFGIIQLVRNPVACFVSRKQAQQSKLWVLKYGAKQQKKLQLPVRIDAEELIPFCRTHAATTDKIRKSCADRLEIQYKDIVTDFQSVMRKVFDHIELPELPILAQSTYRRLPNKTIPQRVSNWLELKLDVPQDVRSLMESDDLI